MGDPAGNAHAESERIMKDKICLITGATSGIGRAAATSLAGMGARVVIAGRDEERCMRTMESIRKETGNDAIDYLLADLSIQAQVRHLAQEFLSRYSRLDVLVNNAGGFFLTRQESMDGIEMTWALNHLSYFLLTNLLLDRLKASASARVVDVASNSHFKQKLDFDDLQMKRQYNCIKAYGRSKLANVLFTYELARRLEGTGVTANALHPGLVATNIGQNNGMLAKGFILWARVKGVSVEEGARTVVYLASSAEASGISGKYFTKEREIRSDPVSYDMAAARRLWQTSEEMTGMGQEALGLAGDGKSS